jgi:hypothetical protein
VTIRYNEGERSMLRALSYTLVILWFVGTPTALWFILRPARKWPLVATRDRAAAICATIFVVSPIGAGWAASTDPAMRAEVEASKASRAAQERRSAARAGDRVARRHPERFIDVSAQEAPSMTGLNSYVVMNGVVTNNAPVAVRDPLIACNLFGPSGTRVGEVEETLYQTLAAGEHFQLSEFQMGLADEQWQTAECRAKRAILAE